MEVHHALLPVTLNLATLSHVRLIALLVNGKPGDRALAHVIWELRLALAQS